MDKGIVAAILGILAIIGVVITRFINKIKAQAEAKALRAKILDRLEKQKELNEYLKEQGEKVDEKIADYNRKYDDSTIDDGE